MQQSVLHSGLFYWWHLFLCVQSVVKPAKATLLIFAAIIRKKPLHIIIADDDEDDREFFTNAMNELAPKVKVVEVAAGDLLMQKLKSKAPLPDIIFLDLNMPRMHGIDCLKQIRADKKLKHIPVVIYSTNFYKEDIENTHRNGADCYVIKPTSESEIKQVLKQLIKREWATHVCPALDEFVLNVKRHR